MLPLPRDVSYVSADEQGEGGGGAGRGETGMTSSASLRVAAPVSQTPPGSDARRDWAGRVRACVGRRGEVFGSKPHKARFCRLCSATTSEALNGISPLTRSEYASHRDG